MSLSQVLWSLGLLWTATGVAGFWLLRRMAIHQQVVARLSEQEAEQITEAQSERSRSLIGWWLYRAGFRGPLATAGFWGGSLLGLVLAAIFLAAVWALGLVGQASALLYAIPGGVGEVFLPFIWGAPLCGALLIAGLPVLVVRSVRQKRVAAVEQDLPITLDLLATLAEAGLGFDAALDRILSTRSAARPLAQDLRLFQVDILGGRSRVEALQRLAKRVDVPWFSIFVSAIIHAEQVGASLAQTLRVQADDLRQRRRERALALAMALPVKMTVPMIICFLPGIMTVALGPAAHQIVQVLDQFLRGSLGR